MLKITAATAAALYLALLRIHDAMPESCDCDECDDREICMDCQAREALTAVDGAERLPKGGVS